MPLEWYKHGEGELERSDFVWVRYKSLGEPLIVDEGGEVRKTDKWECAWVSYKSGSLLPVRLSGARRCRRLRGCCQRR